MTNMYLHVGRHFFLILVTFSPSFSQPVFEPSCIKCCRNSLFYNNQLFFFPSFSQRGSERTSFFLSAHGTTLSSFVLHFPCASYNNQRLVFFVIFTTCLRKFFHFFDNPWYCMISSFLSYFSRIF